MLSMVSKSISGRLINYISTSSGTRRLLLQDFHSPELPGRTGDSILEHYKSLGENKLTQNPPPAACIRRGNAEDGAQKTQEPKKNPSSSEELPGILPKTLSYGKKKNQTTNPACPSYSGRTFCKGTDGGSA